MSLVFPNLMRSPSGADSTPFIHRPAATPVWWSNSSFSSLNYKKSQAWPETGRLTPTIIFCSDIMVFGHDKNLAIPSWKLLPLGCGRVGWIHHNPTGGWFLCPVMFHITQLWREYISSPTDMAVLVMWNKSPKFGTSIRAAATCIFFRVIHR